MPQAVWPGFIVLMLGLFAAFELTGYLGAPWGTLTAFIRTEEQAAGIIRWVLLLGLSIATVHLVGDFP